MRLDKMLKSAPGANTAGMEMWDRMHTFNGSFFETYFQKAYMNGTLDVPMWDSDVALESWNEGNNSCEGMRYKSSGNKHGVVRTEYLNGSVEESTWYGADQDSLGLHGLRRLIVSDKVHMQFWIFGELQFHMSFDNKFVETDRWLTGGDDKDYLLMDEIFAYKFSKKKIDRLQLQYLLQSNPVALHPSFNGTQTMWHCMNPIELEMAEALWEKTNKTAPMLPLADLEYSEWTEIIGNTSKPYFNVIRNYGTRAK